jgi:hypothetical protein
MARKTDLEAFGTESILDASIMELLTGAKGLDKIIV